MIRGTDGIHGAGQAGRPHCALSNGFRDSYPVKKFAKSRRRDYFVHMFEARIKELELQLAAANESLAALTLVNTGLTSQLADAESRNKKMKRNSRQAESSFNEKLAVAQSRRG